jgi:hypothetical protein
LGEIFGLVESIMAPQRPIIDLNVQCLPPFSAVPAAAGHSSLEKSNPPVSFLKTERCSCLDARAIEMGQSNCRVPPGQKSNPDLLEVNYPNKTFPE